MRFVRSGWIAFGMSADWAAGEETASSLGDLLARVPSHAREEPGIGDAHQELATRIAAHGEKSTDPLIELLDGADRRLSNFGGYCLLELEADAFGPRHLEAMAKAARRHRGWLPNAIADIGTDEAAAFLAREMRRQPQTMAQIDHALARMAPRSIPPLLAAFERAGADEKAFHDALAKVFEDCGERAAAAVHPLTRIALDDEAPLHRRRQAIRLLGAIGPPARGS